MVVREPLAQPERLVRPARQAVLVQLELLDRLARQAVLAQPELLDRPALPDRQAQLVQLA
jgi:hypothetical protein